MPTTGWLYASVSPEKTFTVPVYSRFRFPSTGISIQGWRDKIVSTQENKILPAVKKLSLLEDQQAE
jgi:hypothetical protein